MGNNRRELLASPPAVWEVAAPGEPITTEAADLFAFSCFFSALLIFPPPPTDAAVAPEVDASVSTVFCCLSQISSFLFHCHHLWRSDPGT